MGAGQGGSGHATSGARAGLGRLEAVHRGGDASLSLLQLTERTAASRECAKLLWMIVLTEQRASEASVRMHAHLAVPQVGEIQVAVAIDVTGGDVHAETRGR
jgi:hypothetical protein